MMIERVRNSPFLRCSLLSPFSSKLPGNLSKIFTHILTFNPSAAAATFLLQISWNSIFQLVALNAIL